MNTHTGNKANHVVHARYAGPIPDADQFAKYDSILPGAADRILVMAEQEQASRLSCNDKNTELQRIHLLKTWQHKFVGLIFAFIMGLVIIGLGTYLAVFLKEINAGIGLVVLLLVPTFVIFIAGKYYRSTN